MATRKFKVTGRYEVGGAAPGETVELDPDVVNVDELVRVGLVEPLEGEETPSPDLASGQEASTAKTERSGQTRSARKAAAEDEPGEKAH